MATNDTNQPTSLIWVQGNKLQLALPLQIVTFTDEGKTTEDYNPPSGSTILVCLAGKFRCFRYTPTISDGNVLHIVDNGELPADSYSVTIIVEEPNGTKRRCKWNYIINVYDSNEKVTDYFDDFPDWGSGAILEGSVFYATGGGGGGGSVQSDWTETDTSSLAYIKHKPTLATVATSGSYNDLSNKPTIPAAQIQSDWNQTSTSAKDYIKNKPTIPDVSGKENTSNKTSDISGNASSTTKYPTTKGVADYVEGELGDIEDVLDAILGGDTLSEEKKLTIVAASGTALTASVDNYYLFGSEVGTLAITLTTPSDTTHITKAVFMLTTGSTPAVTFAGGAGINVIAQDGFSIEASTTYEINAIYNGVAWVVAAMKLSSTPINS